MSRTEKGAKGPGWEPWSNRHEKAVQKAGYAEPESDGRDEEICQGCRLCLCVKCGGHIVVSQENINQLYYLSCGHLEETRGL